MRRSVGGGTTTARARRAPTRFQEPARRRRLGGDSRGVGFRVGSIWQGNKQTLLRDPVGNNAIGGWVGEVMGVNSAGTIAVGMNAGPQLKDAYKWTPSEGRDKPRPLRRAGLLLRLVDLARRLRGSRDRRLLGFRRWHGDHGLVTTAAGRQSTMRPSTRRRWAGCCSPSSCSAKACSRPRVGGSWARTCRPTARRWPERHGRWLQTIIKGSGWTSTRCSSATARPSRRTRFASVSRTRWSSTWRTATLSGSAPGKVRSEPQHAIEVGRGSSRPPPTIHARALRGLFFVRPPAMPCWQGSSAGRHRPEGAAESAPPLPHPWREHGDRHGPRFGYSTMSAAARSNASRRASSRASRFEISG